MEEQKNIEQLKSLWNSQKEEYSYSKEDIFGMIHKKSKSNMKWLFVITIIEAIIGIIFILINIFDDNYLLNKETRGLLDTETVNQYSYIINSLSVAYSFIMIILVYYFYNKISTDSAVKDLMSNIKKFRKYIAYYVLFYLLISIVALTPTLLNLFKIAFLKGLEDSNQVVNPQDLEMIDAFSYIIIVMILAISIIVWLIYFGIIYGIFLYRLSRNLKELNKIDLVN